MGLQVAGVGSGYAGDIDAVLKAQPNSGLDGFVGCATMRACQTHYP